MKNCLLLLIVIASISFSQFSLTIDRIGNAKRAGEENTFRATLLNDGKIIRTIERKIPFDVPFPSSSINESTGIWVLTYAFDGFVEVYNAQGIKMWEQNFFKEMGPNYERTITVALGKTSIAFLTSDVTLSNAMVHQFTTDGAKTSETSLPYSLGYEIAMAHDEKTIVAGSYVVANGIVQHSTRIIETKGNIEGNVNILFRKAAFSEDNKFIVLTSDREVVIVSRDSQKEVSRTSTKTDGIITDVIWNEENVIIQESTVHVNPETAFYYSNPTFIHYSKKLKELQHQSIEVPSFKISTLRKNGNSVQFRYNQKSIPILLKQ
ncbi:MAG: hypothetical protein WDA22_01065 [Bacteroidota bacterium]